MNNLLIIAHRGDSKTAPENTLAAFAGAIALPTDLIELDVRCTQDRVLVIYHDPEIQEQPIEQLTWAEVQGLDPNIPTLEMAIACCKGRIRLNVEIKEPGYEVEVVKQLQQELTDDEFVITSFYLGVIRAVRELSPTASMGFLMDYETLLALAEEQHLGAFLKAMKVAFVAPAMEILDSPLLTKVIPSEIPFWVWTVNQAAEIETLIDHPRVAAVITDEPRLAMQLRG